MILSRKNNTNKGSLKNKFKKDKNSIENDTKKLNSKNRKNIKIVQKKLLSNKELKKYRKVLLNYKNKNKMNSLLPF